MTETTFYEDLNSFFKNYLIELPSGVVQVFSSFTYGEMVISFLLLTFVLLFVFKWFWEVFRY